MNFRFKHKTVDTQFLKNSELIQSKSLVAFHRIISFLDPVRIDINTNITPDSFSSLIGGMIGCCLISFLLGRLFLAITNHKVTLKMR